MSTSDNKKTGFYNPNDIVIVKYKDHCKEDIDLFIIYNFLYNNKGNYEFGKCFKDLETHKLIGLLNFNNDNCHYIDTDHYGYFISNINIEYYIPLIEVYTLMGNTDILNKGRVIKEEMRLALEYIRNNPEDEKVILKTKPKQRINRK